MSIDARNDDVRQFVDAMNARLEPLDTACGRAEWLLSTTGEEQHQNEAAEARAEWMKVFADRDAFERLAGYHAERASFPDPLVTRQIEALWGLFLEYGFDPEIVDEMAAIESELTMHYSTHRGRIGTREVSSNEIARILHESTDSDLRRAAWEASKQIGGVVAPDVLRLAHVRNENARRLGFRDYYALQLASQEIDEAWLFGTLERLREATEAPFARQKAFLDARLADRFGCSPADLRPWHYADPFFQERPDVDEVRLDPYFEGCDVEALTLATYDGLDLDIRDIIARSDLYERSGKDQSAFCIDIGNSGDVRVLCNLQPNRRWMEVSLHEFGHAIYDTHIDRSLPYLLRMPAHTNTTEAIAMLMGRLPSSPEWLVGVFGLDSAEVDRLDAALCDQMSMKMLLLVRWCLVMAHFERDLYADPARTDLNALWWDHVGRFQRLQRSEGRDEPDWAAKLHIALRPVYYHNYMIGELIASQILDAVERECGGLVNTPAAGRFLQERVFRPGATQSWDRTVASVTGRELVIDHFIRQFVAGHAMEG